MNPRTIFSLVTAVIGVSGAIRDLRALRDGDDSNDRLAMIDGVFSAAAAVTGLVIAYRSFRAERAGLT